MRFSSCMMWPAILAACTSSVSAAELPARDVPGDFALRDAWMTEHFPKGQPGTHAEAVTTPRSQSAIVVLNSYDLVFLNEVPGKGLGIADQKFAHGVYCHASTRLKVILSRPAKSFSSTVGVLTNPDSQGGSIVFFRDRWRNRCVHFAGHAPWRSGSAGDGRSAWSARVRADCGRCGGRDRK